MKVRSDYVNHLRNLDLISTKFIPNIFNLLNLYDGVKKAFKLDYWGIDEYYIDCEATCVLLSMAIDLVSQITSQEPYLAFNSWLRIFSTVHC